jgi:tRNA (cmo5U34)-methyltransferase
MAGDLEAGDNRWDEGNSAVFVEYGRYFVPEREAQLEYFAQLIPELPGPFQVVEIGCGEGLLAAALLKAFPRSAVHGFDGSAAMRQRAREALAPFGERFQAHPFDLADRGWRRFPWPVHAVVSSLAVHHLDGAGKRELFADMASALVPGGVLLIADLVLPQTSRAARLAARAWDGAVRQRSLDLAGCLEPFERFQSMGWNHYAASEDDPVDKPSPLLDQLHWLEDAGFEKVDVFWMKAGHALFGGSKPDGGSTPLLRDR